MPKKELDPAIAERIVKLNEEYQPFTAYERSMIEHLALCEFRVERFKKIEEHLVALCVREIKAGSPGVTEQQAKELISADKRYSTKLRLLRRTQASAERSLQRAVKELADAVKRRKAQYPMDLPKLYSVH